MRRLDIHLGAQGLVKVGEAYAFFCLKGRGLNYFGRWESMQIFHRGEESEESHLIATSLNFKYENKFIIILEFFFLW
jgi:hypothetical protein